jgi:ABC-2 type transport system permease protein
MRRILLIARREYMAYARTVGFWLSLLALPFFAVVGGMVPMLIQRSEPVRSVALIEDASVGDVSLASAVREALAADEARRQARALRLAALPEAGLEGADGVRRIADSQGYEAGLAELRRVAPRAGAGFNAPRPEIRLTEAPAALAAATDDAALRAAIVPYLDSDGALDAVVILSRADGAPRADVWSASASDRTVEAAVRDALVDVNRLERLNAAGVDAALVRSVESFRPAVQMFSPRSASGGEVSFRDRLPGIIGFVLGFILWSLVITGASILLNSVMEEKANKVLEVLLSSASPTEILAGKVLGVAMLTLTVMLAWSVLGIGGLAAGLPQVAADIGSVMLQGGLIGWLLIYLVGGYLMYAVVFAAIGAFCETPRDAQTLMGPLMMVLVVPLIVMQMAVRTPDAVVIKVLSWIPLFTPFLMPARIPNDPPMIEILGTIAGMAITVVVMVWLSSRAFRAGALSDVKLSWRTFGSALRGGER